MLRRTFSRERVVAGVLLLWLCVGVGGANTSASQTVQELIEQAEQVLRAHSSYPDALAQVIPLYRAAIERNSEKALLHRRLAWACLEFGGLVEVGHTEWYRCGQQAAERALELDETNAEAHFLYAATTGLLSEQLPFWRISPKTPFELEQHLSRALALDPKHARALNMMGMLLNEVPGPLRLFLHGEKEQAEGYLTQAVDVDPTSTSASPFSRVLSRSREASLGSRTGKNDSRNDCPQGTVALAQQAQARRTGPAAQF